MTGKQMMLIFQPNKYYISRYLPNRQGMFYVWETIFGTAKCSLAESEAVVMPHKTDISRSKDTYGQVLLLRGS